MIHQRLTKTKRNNKELLLTKKGLDLSSNPFFYANTQMNTTCV